MSEKVKLKPFVVLEQYSFLQVEFEKIFSLKNSYIKAHLRSEILRSFVEKIAS
jgi:hypothetical protein